MLAEEIVFSMEEEPYRWRDVILAAVRRGDWRAAERRTREGAAATNHAESTDNPLPPEAIDEAGREFRYDRDLVTAQSMEEWLAKRNLSVTDWAGHLERQLERNRWSETLADLVARYPINDEDAARLTLIDVTCSGELRKWAQTLAAHAAVHSRMAPATEATLERSSITPSREVAAVASLLELAGEEVLETTRRLEHIEDSFDRFRNAQLTDRALQDFVGQRQLDWVRFDCRIMSFPDEGMAAEAALLLREDDEGFTGVYSVAHAEPRSEKFFLDEIEAPIRDRFLGVRAGDVLGPMRINDEFRLYQIEEKLLPKVDDPEVRKRAEDGVLKAALARQVNQKAVQWHAALSQ
jgi:hypothetical protein